MAKKRLFRGFHDKQSFQVGIRKNQWSWLERMLGNSSKSAMPDVTPILIDLSKLTNAPTSNDLRKMAYLAEALAFRFKSRIAYFVVTPGFVTLYSLAAFTVRADRAEVRAFTNQTTAIKWLYG